MTACTYSWYIFVVCNNTYLKSDYEIQSYEDYFLNT